MPNTRKTPLQRFSTPIMFVGQHNLFYPNNQVYNNYNYVFYLNNQLKSIIAYSLSNQNFTQVKNIILSHNIQGAWLNIQDNIYGYTALHAAIFTKDKEFIKYLLKDQTLLNLKDNYHCSPLGYAINLEQEDIVKMIYAHNPKFFLDSEIIGAAISSCNENICKYILDKITIQDPSFKIPKLKNILYWILTSDKEITVQAKFWNWIIQNLADNNHLVSMQLVTDLETDLIKNYPQKEDNIKKFFNTFFGPVHIKYLNSQDIEKAFKDLSTNNNTESLLGKAGLIVVDLDDLNEEE